MDFHGISPTVCARYENSDFPPRKINILSMLFHVSTHVDGSCYFIYKYYKYFLSKHGLSALWHWPITELAGIDINIFSTL